jgi:hypothetical protein
MQNLERQIAAIESNLRQGKVKNVYAAQNKINNLKAYLAAQNKANYWSQWMAR